MSLDISVRKDGNNKNITIEKIANGYLIIQSKDYKNKKGEWKYETIKTYSKEDPLKTKEEETESLISKFLEEYA